MLSGGGCLGSGGGSSRGRYDLHSCERVQDLSLPRPPSPGDRVEGGSAL